MAFLHMCAKRSHHKGYKSANRPYWIDNATEQITSVTMVCSNRSTREAYKPVLNSIGLHDFINGLTGFLGAMGRSRRTDEDDLANDSIDCQARTIQDNLPKNQKISCLLFAHLGIGVLPGLLPYTVANIVLCEAGEEGSHTQPFLLPVGCKSEGRRSSIKAFFATLFLFYCRHTDLLLCTFMFWVV